MNEQDSRKFQVLHDTMIEGFREVKQAIELNVKYRHDEPAIEISRLRDDMQEADVTMEIARLQLENSQIIEERDALQANIDEARSDVDQYRSQNEKLLELRQLLEAQKKKAEKRSAELKDIILKDVRSSEEPPDSDMIDLFCEIRARIQTVVHEFYSTTSVHLSESYHQSDIYKSSKAWFATWNFESETIRHARLRALVFEQLQENIFSSCCFGLSGDIEVRLAEFESLIIQVNADKKSDVADWRVRTISLAQRMESQNPKPLQIACSIYEYLRPPLLLESEHLSEKEADIKNSRVEAMILEICQKAYALTIKMRQCRSTYQIIGIERGERFNGCDETPLFTPQDMSALKDNLVGLEVSFTIFGALVKVSDRVSAGEEHILEKAHVICQ